MTHGLTPANREKPMSTKGPSVNTSSSYFLWSKKKREGEGWTSENLILEGKPGEIDGEEGSRKKLVINKPEI